MTDGFNIEKVSDLLKSDRRFTYDEIATEVSISKGSVHTIIRDHLEMRKVAAHLTSDQIELRLEIATDLLEGNDFLSRIVAIDETWVRSYEPSHRHLSGTTNHRGLQNIDSLQGNSVAYDIHGKLTRHRVPNGQTAMANTNSFKNTYDQVVVQIVQLLCL